MTREEAKELLPIIQAWAEGKNIQFLSDGEWHDINQADFTCYPDKYRIKPEPKYRPFKSQEECWEEMLKHQPFGWIKNNDGYIFNILAMLKTSVKLNECYKNNCELFKGYKFIDGTPFGIKEE